MRNKKALRKVLFDNYTLQAAYGYFENNKRGTLYEESVSNLVESIVIYDRIYVPKDVLELNSACKSIADKFKGIIIGSNMPFTPDLHHHKIETKVVNQFRNSLKRKKPFKQFENRDAYDIEQTGRPAGWTHVHMGNSRYDRPLTFSDRHTYYAWFCVKLASELGLNYVPNPTRINLFNDPEFMEKKPFADFGKEILNYLEPLRKKYAESKGDTEIVPHIFKSPVNI